MPNGPAIKTHSRGLATPGDSPDSQAGSARCRQGQGGSRVWTPGKQSAQGACLRSLPGINAAQNFFARITASHEPTSLLLNSWCLKLIQYLLLERGQRGRRHPGQPEAAVGWVLGEERGGEGRGRENFLFSQIPESFSDLSYSPPNHLPPLLPAVDRGSGGARRGLCPEETVPERVKSSRMTSARSGQKPTALP